MKTQIQTLKRWGSGMLAACMMLAALPMQALAVKSSQIQYNGVTYQNVESKNAGGEDSASTRQFIQDLLLSGAYGGHADGDQEHSTVAHWQYLLMGIGAANGEFAPGSSDEIDRIYKYVIPENICYVNTDFKVDKDNNKLVAFGGGKSDYTFSWSGLSYADSVEKAAASMENRVFHDYNEVPLTSLSKGDAVKENEILAKDTAAQPVYWALMSANRRSVNIGHYISWGLIFSDFSISPILPEDASAYVLDPAVPSETSAQEQYASSSANYSAAEAEITQTLTTNKSVTATSDVGGRTQLGLEETITASAGLSIADIFKVGGSVGLTASQVFETSWNEGKASTEETSSSNTVSIKLPAHTTAVMLQSKDGISEQTANYDCPIVLNFKVTMVEYTLNPNKGSGSVGDPHTQILATFAPNARKNLHVRGVVNQGRDVMEGFYWSGQERAVIKQYPQLKSMIPYMASHATMSYVGGAFTFNTQQVSQRINGITPIYPLSKIQVSRGMTGDGDKWETNMMVGDNDLYLNNIGLEGLNASGVPYYGFDASHGQWILVDAQGHAIAPQDSTIVSMDEDAFTGAQKLKALSEGTVYLKYLIDEHQDGDAWGYDYLLNGQYMTNDKLERTAYIKVMVSEKPFDGSVSATSSLVTYMGDADINLEMHEDVEAAVLDATGKEINAAIRWEAKELETKGVKVENNMLSATKPGTYQIRACYANQYSDWVEVRVLDAKAAKNITILDLWMPAILEDQYADAVSEIDLTKLTAVAEDQYGQAFTLDESKLDWYVDGIYHSEKKFTPSAEGIYQIQATYEDKVWSNALVLWVLEARYPVSLTVEESEIVLYHDGDPVDLTMLRISAVDQYGQAFALDASKFKWSLSQSRYASLDGQSLTGIANGSETLTLHYPAKDGEIVSQPITVSVQSQRMLNTLFYGYTGETAREGTTFDLSTVPLEARDQNGKIIALPDSVTWSIEDANGIAVTLQDTELHIPDGIVAELQSLQILLKAQAQGYTAVTVPVFIKQASVLSEILVRPLDDAFVPNLGDAYVLADCFAAYGLDQYGDFIEILPEWVSSHPDAVSVDNSKGTFTMKKEEDQVALYCRVGDIESNHIALYALSARRPDSLVFANIPDTMLVDSDLDLWQAEVTVYDQYGKPYTQEELWQYSAQLRWSIGENQSSAYVENNRWLRAGDTTGSFSLICGVANATSRLTVRVVNTTVERITPEKSALDASGGTNAITLEGLKLNDGIVVTAFDANGNAASGISGVTMGNESVQTVTLTFPKNTSTTDAVSYTLKYSLDGGNTYMEAPTATVSVAAKKQTGTNNGGGGGGGSSSAYTISYLAGGGTGSERDTGIASGATYTVKTLAETNIKREGYTFAGWNTKEDGSGTAYAAGDKIQVSASLTLYAQWSGAQADETVYKHQAYISGFADGTVRPEQNITRAEIAKILYAIADVAVGESASFDDVQRGAWYYDAVTALTNQNIIAGYEDHTFRPNQSITRAEFVALVARYAKLSQSGTHAFLDVTDAHWANAYIAAAHDAGWIGGYADGTFRPDATITRAEAIAIVNRMLGISCNATSLEQVQAQVKNFTDNQNTSAWYYYDVIAATNSCAYKIEGENQIWITVN